MTELTHKQKLEQAGIRRHGSLEAYKKFMSEMGKKGGTTPRSKPTGFARMSPEERAAAGQKGAQKRWKNAKKTKS